MRRHPHIPASNCASAQAGYALLSAVIFVLVLTLAGLSFFSIASYETRSAIHAHRSQQAFYLADAAIERARAMFLDDRTWRAGWTNEALGAGHYDLAVDTVIYLGEDALRLRAVGRSSDRTRRIEAVVEVPPSAYGLTVLVVGDADVGGNLCLGGSAHINGDGDFGNNDAHLACGDYTEGFVVTPPPIFTEPDYYPDATYYRVRGTHIGGQYQARIFNRAGMDITTALGDSLVGITTYMSGANAFSYDFTSNAMLTKYFDETTGVFRRAGGDAGVVVDFGAVPLADPPGLAGISNITLDGSASSVLTATIINTRFTGLTEAQRQDPAFWQGGLTTVKQIALEPHLGIALITKNFQKVGGANTSVGTETWPALVYMTGDVVAVNSNFELRGSLICLGDWNSIGGPSLIFDPGFLASLPAFLSEEWDEGVSGTMKVLSWREVASGN